MVKIFRVSFVFLFVLLLSTNAVAKEQTTTTKIKEVIQDAYNKYKGDMGGANADYIKALDIVNPNIFGITFVDTNGNVYEVGNTQELVSIQSISKVFTAALVMSEQGSKFVQNKIGVNATGAAFNSILPLSNMEGVH